MALQLSDPSAIFIANDTDGNTGNPARPSVAVLSNGNYVVTWYADDFGTFQRSVYYQVYSAAGVEVGGIVEITERGPIADRTVDLVSVAALTGGGFVLAYRDTSGVDFPEPDADRGVFKIRTITCDNGGNELSSALLDGGLPQPAPGYSASWNDIAALDDGGYVVVWASQGSAGLIAQQFGPGGSSPVTLAAEPIGSVSVGKVAGGYVAVYDRAGADGDQGGIYARRVIGGVAGAEFRVNTTTAGDQFLDDQNRQVAGLANGGFVVVWTDAAAGTVRGQIFNALGGVVGVEFSVTVAGEASLFNPEVTALSAGGFAVAGQTVSGSAVGVKIFDAAGNRLGVLTEVTGAVGAPSLDQMANGDIVFAFTDGGSPAQIGSRIFGIVDAPLVLNGGPGDDPLTGTEFVDLIGGLGGNDTIAGGLGGDTLTGGDGDDTYVNPAGDSVVEAAGAPAGTHDLIQSNASYNLAAAPNVEDIALTGAANINAVGGTGNNRLTGNGGANILNGGGGNDVLAGLGGADTMNGGSGNDIYLNPETVDIITEAAGAAGGLHDRIQTLYSFNISTVANVEDITLVGAANVNAIGNNLANILSGNPGNNTLLGGGGADTITGGAGNDTMNGGNGADLFKFAAANTGADTINGFSTAEDRFNLAGGSFSDAALNGGDTVLTHSGGTIRIVGVTSLSLVQWNALVDGLMQREAPAQSRVAFHHDHAVHHSAPLGHFGAADFLFA